MRLATWFTPCTIGQVHLLVTLHSYLYVLYSGDNDVATSSSDSNAAAIGGAIGGVLLLLVIVVLILVVILLYVRKSQKKQKPSRKIDSYSKFICNM